MSAATKWGSKPHNNHCRRSSTVSGSPTSPDSSFAPDRTSASPYRDRLAANEFERIGVTPDPPALAIRIGAMVGGSDLQYPDEGGCRQFGMKVAVAVRGVCDVVADALPGASDPDGHFAVG